MEESKRKKGGLRKARGEGRREGVRVCRKIELEEEEKKGKKRGKGSLEEGGNEKVAKNVNEFMDMLSTLLLPQLNFFSSVTRSFWSTHFYMILKDFDNSDSAKTALP